MFFFQSSQSSLPTHTEIIEGTSFSSPPLNPVCSSKSAEPEPSVILDLDILPITQENVFEFDRTQEETQNGTEDDSAASLNATERRPPLKRKSRNNQENDPRDAFYKEAIEALKSTEQTQGADQEDEFNIFGRNVAAQLKRILPQNFPIAKRLINEVLFKAEINDISKDTKIM